MTQEVSKRQARRDKIRKDEQRKRLTLIGVISAVALLLAFFLIWPNLPQSVGVIATAAPNTRPQVEDNATGDPNAPVKIVEYSDFQCPYCARFYNDTEQKIVDAYVATGQVYFVYRSFGDFIGAESKAAAEAAYCAGDQNKFWEMHDTLFANHTGENVGDYTNARIVAYAQAIGLEMGSFRTCFNGDAYSDRVDQDARDGLTADIQSTPSFVITYTVNGQTVTELVAGAEPFATFQTRIEAALAATRQ